MTKKTSRRKLIPDEAEIEEKLIRIPFGAGYIVVKVGWYRAGQEILKEHSSEKES